MITVPQHSDGELSREGETESANQRPEQVQSKPVGAVRQDTNCHLQFTLFKKKFNVFIMIWIWLEFWLLVLMNSFVILSMIMLKINTYGLYKVILSATI